MTPVKASKNENELRVWRNLYPEHLEIHDKFSVGDNYLGKSIYYNTDQVQPVGQVFCGHLCLYVLKELSAGHEF